MNIKVLKINEVVFEGEASGVTVPATSGEMQLLDGHAPIVATLKAGTVQISGQETSIEIEHGYLEATQKVFSFH